MYYLLRHYQRLYCIPGLEKARFDIVLFSASLFFSDNNLVQCCYSKIMLSQIVKCWIKPVTKVQSKIINIFAKLSFLEFYYDDAKHLYLLKTLIINIYHPCSHKIFDCLLLSIAFYNLTPT
jgi:hypothetical protein